MIRTATCALLLTVAAGTSAFAQTETFEQAESAHAAREAARSFEAIVNEWYAYPERLPGGEYALTDELRREAETVDSESALLKFAERALFLLADHHAITSASFSDSWAIVPSYADLWVEKRDDRFLITAVKAGSPAERAGIATGQTLIAINGMPVAGLVSRFWDDLGAASDVERAGFAARVLAAGRRDRLRVVDIRDESGMVTRHELPSLYSLGKETPPIEVHSTGTGSRIRFNDSLGRDDTIEAFDQAMASLPPDRALVLDFTDTPSGGNTSVARAIMGWFVASAQPYQRHELPVEERRTGIARQWTELVAPRAGKFHAGEVTIEVGRWTGSMGEGLAVGFDALGKCVYGRQMAGLLGAITDIRMGQTSLAIKLPYERLSAVDGTPREEFEPKSSCN